MNALSERENMKFIVSERTFNTATSKTLAIASGSYIPVLGDDWYPAQTVRFEDVIYRTQKGALFLHEHETGKYDKGKPVVKDSVREMTPQEAVEWIEAHGARILDETGLPLPDEL